LGYGSLTASKQKLGSMKGYSAAIALGLRQIAQVIDLPLAQRIVALLNARRKEGERGVPLGFFMRTTESDRRQDELEEREASARAHWRAQGFDDAAAGDRCESVPPEVRGDYDAAFEAARGLDSLSRRMLQLRRSGLVPAAIADKLGLSDARVRAGLKEFEQLGLLD
jgi:hypothetical protein